MLVIAGFTRRASSDGVGVVDVRLRTEVGLSLSTRVRAMKEEPIERAS